MFKRGELFLAGTDYSDPAQFYNLIDSLFQAEWVVYLKESFKNPESVIEYLARYTHRIAISNYRILKLENERVFFSYKDYKENNQKKTMSLPVLDFMRRFMLHVVPSRYVRIRYYGLMANRNRRNNLQDCYEYFELEQPGEDMSTSWDEIFFSVTGIDLHKCPVCGIGYMVCKEFLKTKLYHPPPEISA